MTEPALEEFQLNDLKDRPQDLKKAFDEDGGIIVRGLLDKEELEKVTPFVTSDTFQKFRYKTYAGKDYTETLLWKYPGNDITGMVARSEKVGGTSETLLGGEVYLYHGKMIMKDPKVGGPFLWHQDYGYWYQNMILRPDLLTVWIALDSTKKDNGCVQILKGTHKLGRIDHGSRVNPGQITADPNRLEEINKHYDTVYAEVEPGDAIFFHANTLHASSANTSGRRRWGLLFCYNRADNDMAGIKHHHPNYNPLNKVPDSAIRECTCTELADKEFVTPVDILIHDSGDKS